MTLLPSARRLRRSLGVTLIELMVTLAIIGILASVAYPSYMSHVTRSSREAAQAQLIELAGIQEKIFLNSNAYTSNVSTAYNGNSSGGLGATGGKSADGRYTLSVSVSGASYTLTASPIAGTTQGNDGSLTINSSGTRTWGSKTW